MNEENHIQVIIAGYPGAGKTTVANIVCAALKDAGIEKVSVSDEFAPGELEESWSRDKVDRCARDMADNSTTVHVQTRQIRSLPYVKPE